MLQRLHEIRRQQASEKDNQKKITRPFAGIGKDLRKSSDSEDSEISFKENISSIENGLGSPPHKKFKSELEEEKFPSPKPKMLLSPSKFGPAIVQKEISGKSFGGFV